MKLVLSCNGTIFITWDLSLSENILYILLIAVVGLAALVINFIISRREQREAAKRKRLTWLQAQIEQVLQTSAALRTVSCKPEIVNKIDEYAISLIEEVSRLAPESELFQALSKQKDATDNTTAAETSFTTDKSLKRVQIYINFAEKLLVDLVKKQKVSLMLAKGYKLELYWLRVTVVVDAHIAQGERMLAAEDPVGALSHFRHAKALLLRANIQYQYKLSRLNTIHNYFEEIQPKRSNAQGTLAKSMERFLQE